MMTTITIKDVHADTRIVAVSCVSCGVIFGLGANFQKQRRDDHKTFYCPNGHTLSYNGPTEADKLRTQLDRARSAEQAWRDQAETAERRRRAEKAAKTRLKRRVANGVCPCCQRSFTNLAQHMAGQHPDYTEAGE